MAGDWRWKKYINCQQEGKVQFFTDPMNDMHLYFGYILACCNEYEMNTIEIDIEQIAGKVDLAKNELIKLQGLGVIDKNISKKCKLIIFEECY